MLAFKHFVALLETPVAASVGTYSLRHLDKASAEALHAWMDMNDIPAPVPAKDLHTSVITAKNDVPEYKPDRRSLKIRPGSYALQRLGQALVLRFKSSEMTQQNSRAEHMGAKMLWPQYIPHVTLTYNLPTSFDLQGFRLPPFYLEFEPEQVKEFDGSYAHSVRESLCRFQNFVYATAWLGQSK